jgi:quercetin 2,3-dioxygenase
MLVPPRPAPDSWAADPAADVAIWQITLAPGGELTLPPATREAARRTLYVHVGAGLKVEGEDVGAERVIEAAALVPLRLSNGGPDKVEILLLQGVPIGEPVVAHGPFVMNNRAEIEQALGDFRRTQFGGWPWPTQAPVHPAGKGRFARLPGQETELTPP